MKGIFDICLNFSGIYPSEDTVSSDILIDLSHLDETECYCSDQSATVIRKIIRDYPYNSIHWIDGGDYHYVSLFWTEKIERQFILILFDNHSDDMDSVFGKDLLSCGSWVKNVRNLPLCKSAVHINNAEAPLPFLPDGVPVYLSIDKDVLSRDYARTNWDQGNMTLEELFYILDQISSSHEILGVDVCGGISESKGATSADLAINRNTDFQLSSYLKKLLKNGRKDD